MKPRRSIIVADEFYRDPLAVREYALRLPYYLPYEDENAVRAGTARATWWASRFRRWRECPFKSSKWLLDALAQAVGEPVDMPHWEADFPATATGTPIAGPPEDGRASLWNCAFHVKPDNGQRLGEGVHSHTRSDGWNAAGEDGWAGLIYLSPAAPLDGGLHLWRNVDPARTSDWMTPAANWQPTDSFANVFNRLVLVRGDVPHSGAAGWGERLEDGRLFQTFFFRTAHVPAVWPVSVWGLERGRSD